MDQCLISKNTPFLHGNADYTATSTNTYSQKIMHVSWQSGNMCAKNFPLKINNTVLFTLLCSEIWNNTTCELKIVPLHRKLWGNNCFPKVLKFLNIWTYNAMSAALFHKSSHRRLVQVVVFPWAWKASPYVESISQGMHTDYLRLCVSSNWCD